jgi:hypothetical protein
MNNSARKDEIAKLVADKYFRYYVAPFNIADSHERAHTKLTTMLLEALTSYEEERTPPASPTPDENGSIRCPNGHGFVYRSPLDATLQCMQCERDHFAEQLGLVYDHVTNGLLSKPYDLRGVKSTIDDCITEQVNQAVKEELEERTPSGEGWQQRIAAMEPWIVTREDDEVCRFCGFMRMRIETHEPDCLWQNAKDATPPASRGEGASKP